MLHANIMRSVAEMANYDEKKETRARELYFFNTFIVIRRLILCRLGNTIEVEC